MNVLLLFAYNLILFSQLIQIVFELIFIIHKQSIFTVYPFVQLWFFILKLRFLLLKLTYPLLQLTYLLIFLTQFCLQSLVKSWEFLYFEVFLLQFVLKLSYLLLISFCLPVCLLLASLVLLYPALLVISLWHHHRVLGKLHTGGVYCWKGKLIVFIFIHVLVFMIQKEPFFFVGNQIYFMSEVLS